MKIFKTPRSSLIACFIAISFIQGCSSEPEWVAFFYPDIENIPGPLDAGKYSFGRFSDFESCQAAAVAKVRYHLATYGQQGAYQCGFRCTNRQDFGGALVCKETRK